MLFFWYINGGNSFMDNSLSRQILLSILGIAILIVAVVGVSYAVFTTSMDGSKINVINFCIKLII